MATAQTPNTTPPPSSTEAEQTVLGSVIIDNTQIPVCLPLLAPDRFYISKHQEIYGAILKLHTAGDPVDIETLRAELERTGKLEYIGGSVYLATLTQSVPTPQNCEKYAYTVFHHWLVRESMALMTRVKKNAGKYTDHPADLLDRITLRVNELRAHIPARTDSVLTADVDNIINEQRRKYAGETITKGVPTGTKQIDDKVREMRYGEITLLASRPKAGKSSLATQIYQQIIEQKKKPLFITLEMSKEQLIMKGICQIAGIKEGDAWAGRLTQKQLEHFELTAKFIEQKWRIADTVDSKTKKADKSLENILSILHSEFTESYYDVVVVDYLQLIFMKNGGKNQKRHLEIGEILGALISFARDKHTAILGLAQVGRAPKGKDKVPPTMSDLKDSGCLEQDAFCVMILHRNFNDTSANLIVAANRGGPVGYVRCEFEPDYTRFDFDIAPQSAEPPYQGKTRKDVDG